MIVHDNIRLGSKLRSYRKKLNKSQKEMSDFLGIPLSTYSNYENGNRFPKDDTLDFISYKLGISTNDLLYGEFEYMNNNDMFREWLKTNGIGISRLSVIDKEEMVCFTDQKELITYALTPAQANKLPNDSVELIKAYIKNIGKDLTNQTK